MKLLKNSLSIIIEAPKQNTRKVKTMDDNLIIDLYFARDESAITETDKKYGNYLSAVSYNILSSSEDAKECVNDTYFKAWNAIPPHSPKKLKCFLAKITRNLSLNVVNKKNTFKRGEGRLTEALDELEECIPASRSIEDEIDEKSLSEFLNKFLFSLSKKTRIVFVKKYWYLDSIKDISASTGLAESNIKSILLRTRKKLRKALEQEGIVL